MARKSLKIRLNLRLASIPQMACDTLDGQMVMVPFGGTLEGWRSCQMGTSARDNAKSCPCRAIIPCTSTNWGPTGWKAALHGRP